MNELTLLRRLRAVEALRAGATTEGERIAAAEARQRLLRRLAALKERSGPWVEAAGGFVEEGPEEADPLRGGEVELPSAEDLLQILAAWRMGLWSAEEIGDWAAALCDQLLLPEVELSDPRAARVEVLLQLAAMGRQALHVGDIGAIEAFLRAVPGLEAWRAWFGWLAAIDWEARRRAG